ncbi:hypothetical protein PMIN06_009009 [Paraphaeosphaeria minitans]|uniref:SMP-30/Gluconolactonase/LRE-like region domain-containing protein n=1 Tax=Paraphaeosphaeria minitans TaxID=565426 RepID=A0A9P6GMA4_9PLEO|nr:hypothetical protein PMIN01_03119 [Paraphaeosphaeria minitans]
MRLVATFTSFLSLIGVISASPFTKRQSTVTQVYKFTGSPLRAEGIAVRSNGQILVTFFDKGEAWLVDPPTKKASKVATFTDTTCSAAIAEVAPDVFAVVAGKYSNSNTPGSWGVWKVDFSAGGATPTTTLVKKVPESGMWNGLSAFNNDTVLVGDASKGAVFKVNVNTGNYSIAIQDSTMAPASGMPMGIDGIRYANGNIYYTNIFAQKFYKMPIDAEGKKTGSATQIWGNQMADDMYVSPEGVAYVAASSGIQKVTADGKVSNVASIRSSTAVAIGTDKTTLFVAGSDGVISSFKIST